MGLLLDCLKRGIGLLRVNFEALLLRLDFCRESSLTTQGVSGEMGACGLHAGLEPTSSPFRNGGSSTSHPLPQALNNGGWWSGLNGSRPTPIFSHQHQSQAQGSRWTGETPTPTATPTPTPTPAPLLPSAQHPPPPWFQAYLPREVALELLTHEEVCLLILYSYCLFNLLLDLNITAISIMAPERVRPDIYSFDTKIYTHKKLILRF